MAFEKVKAKRLHFSSKYFNTLKFLKKKIVSLAYFVLSFLHFSNFDLWKFGYIAINIGRKLSEFRKKKHVDLKRNNKRLPIPISNFGLLSLRA